MSLEAINAAAELPDLSLAQKSVLIALAWFADDAGARAYPSAHTLARRSGASLRAVRDALAALRKKGLIVATEPSLGKRATVYRLTFLTPAPNAPLQETHPSTVQAPQGTGAVVCVQEAHGTGAAGAPNLRIEPQNKNAPARATPAGRARSAWNGDPKDSPDADVRIAAIEREMRERADREKAETAAMLTHSTTPPKTDAIVASGNGAAKPLTRHVLTEAERQAEIERRRRQAAALASKLAGAEDTEAK